MKPVKYIIIFVLISFSFSVFAQRGPGRQRLEAEKVAFFTEKIGLTTVEAQKFWPIYNDYEQKRENLLAIRRMELRDYLKNSPEVSDREAEKIADKYIHSRIEETDLLEDLHKNLKGILSSGKVLKVYQAEIQFRSYLLEQLKGQGQGQGQGLGKGRQMRDF